MAKNVFSVYGVNVHGKVALKKTISRGKLRECFANLSPCVIGMEAGEARCRPASLDRNVRQTSRCGGAEQHQRRYRSDQQ